MGYPQNCEIWHGLSLGTLIMIQEEPIWRTRWGPCFGHKGAIFWPFWEKGTMEYTEDCEIWHGASLGTLIMSQEEPIWGTKWGPCFCHRRVIFWPFLELLIHWYLKVMPCQIWSEYGPDMVSNIDIPWSCPLYQVDQVLTISELY